MRTTAQKLTECYTYADYLGWGDSVRGELIDGVFYDMTPSQSFSRQSLVCGIL
jgi:hypothetical protein